LYVWEEEYVDFGENDEEEVRENYTTRNFMT
jgi:hypothetical protein